MCFISLSNSTKYLLFVLIFISTLNSSEIQQKCKHSEKGECVELNPNDSNHFDPSDPALSEKANSIDEKRVGRPFELKRPEKYLTKLVSYITKSMNEESVTSRKFDFNNSLEAIDDKVTKISHLVDKLNINTRPIELRLKQTIFEFLISLNISDQCFQSIIHMSKVIHTITPTNALNQTQSWPFKLFDSMGRIPSGLADGVITSFGEYDQCLDIRSDEIMDSSHEYNILGKYCLVKPYLPFSALKQLEKFESLDLLTEETNNLLRIILKKNLNHLKVMLAYNLVADKLYLFHFGLCIPSLCTSDDIENALNQVFYPIARIPIEVNKCYSRSDPVEPLHWFRWLLLLSTILSVIFVSLSSIIHIVVSLSLTSTKRRIIRASKTLRSFSVIEANKRLVSPLNNRLKIADGLMFFYIVWTVVTTSYASIITSGFVGYKKIFDSFVIKVMSDPEYFWLRTLYQRDSIIFLSGVIISYDFFGPNDRPITIKNYIKFLGEKYLRFLPKMIGPMILLSILSLIGSGPNWHSGHKIFVTSCQQNYWKNILFISNFESDSTNHCSQMSWFLSVIFQLQALSPLLMVAFRRSVGFGYLLSTSLLLVSSLAAIAPKLIYHYKLIPYEVSKLFSVNEMRYSANRFFTGTDQYIYIFVFGIIIGHFLRNRKSFDRIIKSYSLKTLLAISCFSLSFLSIAWSENFKDVDQEQNQLNLNVWFVSGRLLWMSTTIWIMYCVDGSKKCIVNRLLSTRLFCALTRLLMTICLTSLITIYYNVMTRKQTIDINHSNQLRILYIDFSQTILFSYLLYIFIEHPIINLLDLCQNKEREKTHNCPKTTDSVELNYVFE